MPYLNIDDGMDEHEKIDGLSDAAYRLLMTSMKFCSRNGTDGFVSLSRARRLTATGKDPIAAELVAAGCWHDIGQGCDQDDSIAARTCHGVGRPGHYIVHDYLQWNHSAAWWDKRRKDETERKAKYRARKAGAAADDDRPASRPAGVTPSVPLGHDAGQDARRDGLEPEPEPEPDKEPIPAPRGGPVALVTDRSHLAAVDARGRQ